jgi:mRNA-degrading endonuclease toxin of MazEF toxin-antitoxin module
VINVVIAARAASWVARFWSSISFGAPSAAVIVVPVTTKRRMLPSHVELDPADSGLAEVGYAKAEDVKSISTDRLVRSLGHAQPHVLQRIEHSLAILLDTLMIINRSPRAVKITSWVDPSS